MSIRKVSRFISETCVTISSQKSEIKNSSGYFNFGRVFLFVD